MVSEADLAVTQMAFAQGGQFGPRPGDENLLVKFYLHPKQNKTKSVEAGRPIYEDVEYVHIMVPGDKDNIVERPARDSDRQRFPRQYEAFKRGEGDALVGTPLAMWPAIARSQVEELAFFNVKTVEQLAALSDTQIQKFMGMRELRTKAKLWLDAAAGNAPIEKLQAEIEERDNVIATMQKQMADLQARLEELEEE